MLNSTATIFTMDIYKPYFNKGRTDKNLVTVGRLSVMVSPGSLAVFILGLF